MRTTDWFDNYLFGTLSAEEKQEFEHRLRTDAAFAKAFDEHQKLVETFGQHEQRSQLKTILKTIHSQEFGNDAKIVSIKQEGVMQKYGKTVAVAASVGFIAVISTIALLSTGGYLLKKQSNEIADLGRKVENIESVQDVMLGAITKVSKNIKSKNYAPANFEGTGFALNNKGYFITSWHMVKNADSVFVTNNIIDRQSARLVYSEPSLDIAIYKIDNDSLLRSLPFPFVFKENGSDIGDKIFTLGYPRKDAVYGEGSVSAVTGFNGDTTMYQVSIPVNPGNSGGPLMDEQGFVVGLIRAKQANLEGTGFAVKSDLIKQSIQGQGDSLKKELSLNTKKNALKGLKRSEQIKKIQPFVFNVMVYKK